MGRPNRDYWTGLQLMAEIAVIGAGIFGATTSLALAEAGHKVTMFDENPDVLAGTSAASTNRLHIGAHYPRDLPTAIQSLESSILFKNKFPETVNNSFPNYYGLVRDSSKTDLKQYVKFLNLLSGRVQKCGIPENLNRLGLNESRLSGFWKIDEGVIDINELRITLTRLLKRNNVKMSLSQTVTEVRKNATGGWGLRTNRTEEQFDAVVRATYATDHIKIIPPQLKRPKKFQLTLNLVIKCQEVFGLTLMDGDFLTVLPQGFEKNLVVYAPGPSVLRTATANTLPPKFRSIGKTELRRAEEELLARLDDWLPGLGPVVVTDRLVAVRTLLTAVELTDARPSVVTQPFEDFFEIWSGKLDHAVQIAAEMRNLMDLKR